MMKPREVGSGDMTDLARYIYKTRLKRALPQKLEEAGLQGTERVVTNLRFIETMDQLPYWWERIACYYCIRADQRWTVKYWHAHVRSNQSETDLTNWQRVLRTPPKKTSNKSCSKANDLAVPVELWMPHLSDGRSATRRERIFFTKRLTEWKWFGSEYPKLHRLSRSLLMKPFRHRLELPARRSSFLSHANPISHLGSLRCHKELS